MQNYALATSSQRCSTKHNLDILHAIRSCSLVCFSRSVCCIIQFRDSHALTSSRNIGRIEWSYSSIETVHHHAIYSSDINKLHFHNVHITTLSSRAFEQNEIQEMSIVESSAKLLGKLFMGGSDIQNLTIDRLEVRAVEEGAFSNINSSLFSISSSKFDQFPKFLFQGSFVIHKHKSG